MDFLSFWRKAAILVVAGGALALAPAAYGQDGWPARAVTIVVPFGPGAANDTFTRAISNVMTPSLGKPVVVENLAGAGGYTGVLSVAEGMADGYTFIESPNSIVGYGPVQKLDFDVMTDVVPVAMIGSAPVSMAIPTTLSVASLEEFVSYAKGRPGELFYGVVGQGSLGSLLTEKFVHEAGLEMSRVDYKSANEAILDLVAGRIQAFFSSPASLKGQADAGQLLIVGYSSEPDAGSPEAPTFAEAGISGVVGEAWWGVFAPVGTPPEIVERMNSEINNALADPGVESLLQASGAKPRPGTPDDFKKVLVEEVEMLNGFIAELDLDIPSAQ